MKTKQEAGPLNYKNKWKNIFANIKELTFIFCWVRSVLNCFFHKHLMKLFLYLTFYFLVTLVTNVIITTTKIQLY